MRIFTIKNGRVYNGTTVGTFELSAGAKIPAVMVGEEGRNRQLGVLPVHLLPEQYHEWQEKGCTTITCAEVSQTKSGRPKLVQRENPTTDDAVIVVCLTRYGFRGGCSHTGDRIAQPCPNNGQRIVPDYLGRCPECGCRLEWDESGSIQRMHPEGMEKVEYLPCPLQVLTEGYCADGIAGRMAGGPQLIGILQKGTVLRTAYTGRLYGDPSEHYYMWTGSELLVATLEERQLADLF